MQSTKFHGSRSLGGRLAARVAAWSAVAALSAGAAFVGAGVAGCGGSGGGQAAKPMVLIEFLFVDRALQPSFPTGVQALPRNAEIIFQFSELVDPTSINTQTIAIRYGPQFQSVAKGSFQVDGSRVIFDPTVSQQGTPNPFGLPAVTQFNVELPAVGIANDVVENLDNDPLLTSFLTSFTTSDGYLRELVPPTIDRVYFIPGQDPFTKQIPGDSIIAFEFSEPMNPATFTLGVGSAPTLTDTVDVRYRDLSPNPNANNPTVNAVGGVEKAPIPGSFTHDATAKIYYFKPLFSFGSGGTNYDFAIQVFQGLKDLSGNALVNPRSFGPYVCDGTGIATGRVLAEGFDNKNDQSTASGTNTADWGFTVPSQLQGAAITTRRAFIDGWREELNVSAGQYNPIADPLIGAKLNNFVTGINPPTADGRRVMYAFQDKEIGANGTITDVAWGPDSNATFAAKYPDVIVRLGFQKTSTLSLATSFSGNYGGSPLVVYQGVYNVAQHKNVSTLTVNNGDENMPLGAINDPAPPQYVVGGNPGQNPVNGLPCTQPTPPNGAPQCLFDFTGFYSYPALTSYFDWDQADPLVDSDSVLVLDVSVKEGDTWQQIRTWYGVTAPNSGILISGYPKRRLYSTYEANDPNPPENFYGGVLNPEPSICDTALTLTQRVSRAETRFYSPLPGDPGGPYPGGVDASAQTTYGTKSDYYPAVIVPDVQSGGATYLIEYQACTAIQPNSARQTINTAFPSTAWTTNINDCDQYPYLRWRITLTANLLSNSVPKITSITIPIRQLP